MKDFKAFAYNMPRMVENLGEVNIRKNVTKQEEVERVSVPT